MLNSQGKKPINLPLPAFTIICLFVVLMITGLAVMPLLSVQLEPSRSYKSISIYFNWDGASAEMIENEVTSKVEGLLATVKGITYVSSTSGKGYGRVFANLDNSIKANEVRYEISTLLRQLYPHLPQGITYPGVYINRPFGNKTLLSYTINGKISAAAIQQFAEKKIKPQLALVNGIAEVNVFGAEPYIWKLRYDQALLTKYQITVNDIEAAVNGYFFKAELGKANIGSDGKPGKDSYTYITLRSKRPEAIEWDKIAVTKNADRIIFLTDLVKISYEEQQPQSYYRINGLNTITLEVVADKQMNYLVLSREIKVKINSIRKKLPDEYRLSLAYDTTDFLKKELNKVAWRSIATLFILLVFIFIISRQIRYLLLILISLISNLLLASIFYYFFKLEIHLYSLAGITVSMGMIIDNSIVVIDHIRHKNNLRVLLAVTGATLTTIGAVCIIFFLNDDQQIKLLDFAWVMIINLSISLVISLFFIPALLEKLPLKHKDYSMLVKRKRNIVKWTWFYGRLIDFSIRFKKAFILVIILLFGIPIFMLPAKIETKDTWEKIYNALIGSETYNGIIRPWTDGVLGGTLRLFLNEKGRFSYADDGMQKTSLSVRINMPYGARLEQMNAIVADFEQFLSQFKELKQFHSRVNNRNASIDIDFKPAYEKGAFPYALKSQLEEKAVYTGLAEFSVWGVGQGFSNSLRSQNTNYALALSGYNYDRLLQYAGQVKGLLQENMRIEKVTIGSQRDNGGENTNYEFVFQVNDQEKLLVNRLSPEVINRSLTDFSGNERQIASLLGVPVVTSPINTAASVWQVMNEPVRSDSVSYVRLKEFATIGKEKAPNEILRENQQYQIVVNYNFIGDYSLGSIIAEKVIDRVSVGLPLGYSIKQDIRNFWSGEGVKLTWAIILTISIVFVICSILLNNILQPLAVIAMIPVSFIGVFLSAWFFDYPFDEGGYAALIILCGVVVNAALYILNDYNNLRQDHPGKPPRIVFIKAYNSKIIPVLLSTMSMVLSLVPFIIYANGDVFWYALAMSVTGGLIFSMLAILVFLPMLLIKNPKSNINKSKSGILAI